ncbi:MAG: ribonuclease P protein subunit [Candidatus Bilamarchaeaceae archaeon]
MSRRKSGRQAAEAVLFSTLIGTKTEIINSTQYSLVGVKGKIVDETKNLFVIETEGGKEIKIPKASCFFRFFINDKFVDVDGRRIAFRHYERPKKVKKSAIIRNCF